MKHLRIGTRKSPLAMWQAKRTADLLNANGFSTEIVPVSSEGDLKLNQPIYELGITGVFTKTLDIALINDQIDIAVHSLKDVPTQLANGLELVACLEREQAHDILVYPDKNIFEKPQRTIATGSLRRKAFWLNQFPNDNMVDLRGNVQLRLQKLIDNQWDGAIFAYAGLERSEILPKLKNYGLNYEKLDLMISAPSQGIIGVVAKKGWDLSAINHQASSDAASIERAFLQKLEGGCTAPIGAFAEIENNKVRFHGAILSLDGKNKIEIEKESTLTHPKKLGNIWAEECINNGADKIISEIKQALGK